MQMTGTMEYVKAVAVERYGRFERKSPPTRMAGRRAIDVPLRLVPRGSDDGSGSRAA